MTANRGTFMSVNTILQLIPTLLPLRFHLYFPDAYQSDECDGSAAPGAGVGGEKEGNSGGAKGAAQGTEGEPAAAPFVQV